MSIIRIILNLVLKDSGVLTFLLNLVLFSTTSFVRLVPTFLSIEIRPPSSLLVPYRLHPPMMIM
jgi:hypothetical protein